MIIISGIQTSPLVKILSVVWMKDQVICVKCGVYRPNDHKIDYAELDFDEEIFCIHDDKENCAFARFER